MMRARCVWAWVGLALSISACGDSSDSSANQGLGTGGCLTDAQICQFQKGVSTKADVQNALGNAQEYLGTDAAVYICQEVAGQQIIHNDQVIFSFDSNGRLQDVMVLRQGSGSTPPPTCSSNAASGSNGSGTGSCSSVPRPAPDSTSCQAVVFGTTTTTCTDQSGQKWSETCQGTTCSCSYNDQQACTCSVTSGGRGCCPGQPGAP